MLGLYVINQEIMFFIDWCIGRTSIKSDFCIFPLRSRKKNNFGIERAVYQRAVLAYGSLSESVHKHISEKYL